MSDFSSSIVVSLLSMGIIFAVLSLLALLIKGMVYFLPYQAPVPPSPKARHPAQNGEAASGKTNRDDSEEIAVIQSVLAFHLGKSPGEVHITNVRPL